MTDLDIAVVLVWYLAGCWTIFYGLFLLWEHDGPFLNVGTRSVLFGAHQFLIHPWFVAAAWWKLYGFPFDPRLWIAFFVHDLGYWGKPNMDGPEGECHPVLGARIMSALFDWWAFDKTAVFVTQRGTLDTRAVADRRHRFGTWGRFALLHSRYYAKALGLPPSRLCFADKLAIAMTPSWLYLPMATASGEIREYLKNAQKADSTHWKPTGYDKRRWYAQLQIYMTQWVNAHKDGASDTWTSNRHREEQKPWTPAA